MVADIGEGTKAGSRDWNLCKSFLRMVQGVGSPDYASHLSIPNPDTSRRQKEKYSAGGDILAYSNTKLVQELCVCVCVCVCVR